MLLTIRRWLGITALKEQIVVLEEERDVLKEHIELLKTGKVIVTPDGKLAAPITAPMPPARPRAHTFHQLARAREAKAWRELTERAYPDASKR